MFLAFFWRGRGVSNWREGYFLSHAKKNCLEHVKAGNNYVPTSFRNKQKKLWTARNLQSKANKLHLKTVEITKNAFSQLLFFSFLSFHPLLPLMWLMPAAGATAAGAVIYRCYCRHFLVAAINHVKKGRRSCPFACLPLIKPQMLLLLFSRCFFKKPILMLFCFFRLQVRETVEVHVKATHK